jgi:ribosomal protein S12 methylthiotransferase accessory factor
MNLTVHRSAPNLAPVTPRLISRMLNPMTGLVKMIGFVSRDSTDPRILTAGAELTGVHVLRDRPDPGAASYHIGGGGVHLDEAVIRCLGESVERYCQFVFDAMNPEHVVTASYDEMVARGEKVIDRDKLLFYSPEQHDRPGFPFKPFRSHDPIGWLKLSSLLDDEERWVPAQLLLVGYSGRPGERRLIASVTTGTAAHTDRAAALRNALRELIQIDSAMGHWYSPTDAWRILLDSRVAAVQTLVEQQFRPQAAPPEFYLLPSPDLPGFAVACVIRRPGEVPAVSIGLGMALGLNHALYSALIEGVGVLQMAKRALIDRASARPDEAKSLDPAAIYDLDSNVAWYALPENARHVDAKFHSRRTVSARDLPADRMLDHREESRQLAAAFRASGKELYWMDLTTPDVRELGFTVARVWSPDVLGLCLPSAPPVRHRRFAAYGGATNLHPHPYP